ncbi:DUF5085 family protein [Terrilactibacillus sp. S3-3]|nr:DUF5085 family protein [Terrilactibacillus sp. S3-3]
MIIENERIACRNIISKRYDINYRELEAARNDFLQWISNMRLTPNGNLFYSLNNVPNDGRIKIELFAGVREDDVRGDKDFSFRSYFAVDNMLMTYFSGNVERLTEKAYIELLNFMEDNELEMASPFFFFIFFKGDAAFPYVEIKVGVQ